MAETKGMTTAAFNRAEAKKAGEEEEKELAEKADAANLKAGEPTAKSAAKAKTADAPYPSQAEADEIRAGKHTREASADADKADYKTR